MKSTISLCVGWDSVVGVATQYELDSLGIEGEGEIFHNHPYWLWIQPRLLYIAYWVIPRDKATGEWD
jgi:hypothetical protein